MFDVQLFFHSPEFWLLFPALPHSMFDVGRSMFSFSLAYRLLPFLLIKLIY